jgi:hypothetical protein
MTEEIWKPVVGYEGLYEVSNLGNVKAVEKIVGHPTGQCRRPEKMVKLQNGSSGYAVVNLCKNGKPRTTRVHILVAEAFLKKPEGKCEVDHINRNRKDNRVENLKWCTHKENMNNINTIQYMKGDPNKSKSAYMALASKIYNGSSQAPKTIHQYTLNGEYIATYLSLHDAEAATGISRNSISKVIDKFERKAGEYIWSSQKNDNIKYISKPKSYFHPIQQLNTSGDVIGEWCSINEMMREAHVGYKRIKAGLESGEFKYKNEGE